MTLLFFIFLLTHVVLVVAHLVLVVVVELVIVFVNLVVVRVNVLYHVVTLHALKKQAMAVMVLCVIPVAVLHVEEIVNLARHAVLGVLLMDVIHHVIIGVSVYVKIAVLLNHHRVELLLVRPQVERKHKNSFNKIKRGKRLCK